MYQSRQHIVLSCSASLWNKNLIGCSRAVVILLSLNQSFRQLILHLPPCLYSSLSSSLPPSPRTCLSCGTCFSGCLCWQHVDLCLYFLAFLKKGLHDYAMKIKCKFECEPVNQNCNRLSRCSPCSWVQGIPVGIKMKVSHISGEEQHIEEHNNLH